MPYQRRLSMRVVDALSPVSRLAHAMAGVAHRPIETARLSLFERRGGTVIHCFGDSHSRVFRWIDREGLLRRTRLAVTVVRGATALGLVNPNSKTAALPTFSAQLERTPRHRPVLVMLGEVDCGYLIWYRNQVLGHDLAGQMVLSLRNYSEFLAEVQQRRDGELFVAAVPLPTISDGQDWGEVGNARRKIRASLFDRTRMTQDYNAELRRMCDQAGFRFLDFESELLDEETGLIHGRFLNEDPLDHHLADEPFGSILASRLDAAGYV